MYALCVYNMHSVWILMAWETHGNPWKHHVVEKHVETLNESTSSSLR